MVSRSVKLLLISALAIAVVVLPKQSRNVAEVQVPEMGGVKEVSAITKLQEATNSEGTLSLSGISESKEDKVRYEFLVIDNKEGRETRLYETWMDRGKNLIIPRNSWAPDNKYVFLKMQSLDAEDYYVFKADGEEFSDGRKYITVAEYWNQRDTTDEIKEITGWAGDDLLMVYTTREDGSDGLAYWFVINTRQFMNVRQF